MITAIDLNNKLLFQAYKVYNMVIDNMLSTKPHAQLVGFDVVP